MDNLWGIFGFLVMAPYIVFIYVGDLPCGAILLPLGSFLSSFDA